MVCGAATGIVQSLHFPGDNAVLDVNVPRAAACAVHTVRTADHFVVRPAVAVELFPLATLGINLVANPGDGVAHRHWSPRSDP